VSIRCIASIRSDRVDPLRRAALIYLAAPRRINLPRRAAPRRAAPRLASPSRADPHAARAGLKSDGQR